MVELLNENFFKSNIGGDRYYNLTFDNLKNYGLTLTDLFDKVITEHKKVAKLLRIPEEVVMRFMVKYARTHGLSNFVDFSITQKPNSILVAKKAYYKRIYTAFYKRPKIIYYNVYVVQNPYINVSMLSIIKEILKVYHPIFSATPFVETKPKYKENSCIFKLNPQMKLSEISSFFLENEESIGDNYTIEDLINIFLKKEDENTCIVESKFKVYYNVDDISICLTLTEDYSLNIPLLALLDKDWEIIENVKVYSIKTDKKGIWFDGKQKDAPYFNHPLVEEVKKNIYSLNTNIL